MRVSGRNHRFQAKTGFQGTQRLQLVQAVPNTLLDGSGLISQRGIVPIKGGAVKITAVLPQNGIIVIPVAIDLTDLISAGQHSTVLIPVYHSVLA